MPPMRGLRHGPCYGNHSVTERRHAVSAIGIARKSRQVLATASIRKEKTDSNTRLSSTMSDLHPSRRRFLNLGAAAGSSLLLPPGLIRSAHAAAPLPAVAEQDAVIAFGHTGPVTDEGWTWSHDQGMKAVK